MLKILKFTVGDLVMREMTDPADPARKIFRQGIIKEVENSTVVINWFHDPRFLDPGDMNLRISSKMFRTQVMNGSLKHYPAKK